MSEHGREAAIEKMRAAGQAEVAIRGFARSYDRLVSGESPMIASSELEPAPGVPALEELPAADAREALSGVAVLKLNGGLATTMGLQQPKSLLEARDGRSFLDVIIGQILALRRRFAVRLPLVLMNSDVTREPTLRALAAHPDLPVDGLAPEFLQSMVPKLDAETLEPVRWGRAPDLEWCPPGHGDVYGSLLSSGMLEALIEQGFRYVMISNSDNLGATIDQRIAAYLETERIPFLMEVVQGTEADRKGGHIARRRDEEGRLVLREVAQTPDDDAESFRDFRRWRYYNTNTLWVALDALGDALESGGGGLELPLIVNRKTVDPRDPESTPVLQLETAMGAAIGSFPGARLLLVPRTRFVPVKTTDDLLVLRSDVYRVGEDLEIRPIPEREGRLPFVELDKRFYRLLDQFEQRFPDGPPSLREADRFVVEGDVTFGGGVVVRGDVAVRADAPTQIAPAAVLLHKDSQRSG